MPMIALLALASVVAEGPEFEVSLETESAEAGWARAGFRLGLGYALEGLFGEGLEPGGLVHAATLRAGARLDRDWSLLGSLSYGVLAGDSTGLRFGATIEPTFHLLEGLTISAGLGIGGFVVPDTGQPTPELDGNATASYTWETSDPLLGSCQGAGVLAVARVEYLWVVGHLLSTGPSASFDAQWTRCIQPLNRANPDTGEAIELRQFWRHLSLSLGWTFWWR